MTESQMKLSCIVRFRVPGSVFKPLLHLTGFVITNSKATCFTNRSVTQRNLLHLFGSAAYFLQLAINHQNQINFTLVYPFTLITTSYRCHTRHGIMCGHTHADATANSQTSINLNCMSLDSRKTLEHAEESTTHTELGTGIEP